MAPPLWDPWKLFDIVCWSTSRNTCAGIPTCGPPKFRCINDIEDAAFKRIRSIIWKLRTMPPNEELPILATLARLCLCSAHQNQKDDLAKKWKTLVKYTREEYEKVEKLKRNFRELKIKLEETREEYALNKAKYELNMEGNAKLVKEIEQHKLSVTESRQEAEALKAELNKMKAQFDKELELARRIMSNSSAATRSDIEKLREKLCSERENEHEDTGLTSWLSRLQRLDRISKLAEDIQDLEKARQTWGRYKLDSEVEIQRQSMIIYCLRGDLEQERRDIEKYKTAVGKERESHLLKIQKATSEVEKCHLTAQKDKRIAEKESENQSMIIQHVQNVLEKERQDMEEYKTITGIEQEGYLLQIQKIRSELDSQHRIEKKERRAIDIERRGMLFVIRSIRAALERERQITTEHEIYHEELKCGMEQAMRIAGNRDASLLGEIRTLQIKTEKFEEMENDLILTKSNETALYEQVQNLNSQLICAHESKSKLDGEYAEIKAREGTLSKGLEITQLSLEESRSVNEELKNIAAENELGFIVERSQLLMRISEAEKQLSTTFWSVLRGRVNGWATVSVQWVLRSISRSWILVRKERTKRND